MDLLSLTVTAIEAATPSIRALTLSSADGRPLPGWTPGAHINLHLPSDDTRSYSLINTSSDSSARGCPTSYRLGVRLEEESLGGSRFVHGLRVGDTVRCTPPGNHFPLIAHEGETVLVAGGIGITPIVSMAAELSAMGRPFRLVYAGRSRDHLAFLSEVEALCGSRLIVHGDDTAGVFDMPALMASLGPSASLYVCGPARMIETAIDTAAALGWEKGRLHFEIFATPVPVAGDSAFDVVLARSGRRVTVPRDRTILDTLIAAGENPAHDCKAGDCGLCQVGVLDGVPDHRDFYLSEKERASNTLMQICVSRSKTPVLVLDV